MLSIVELLRKAIVNQQADRIYSSKIWGGFCMLKWLNISVIILLAMGLSGCKYKEDEDVNTAKLPTPLNVQMQVLGSTIEGMTVCLDNNVCKKTDSKGMVAFEKFGSYTFKINDMHISTLEIDNNKTLISPYVLFDKNDTLAKDISLVIHAFDKSKDPSDESVLLSFSSYIPKAESIEAFIADNKVDGNLTYVINDHNNTIDFNASKIYRDCKNEEVSVYDTNVGEFVTRLELKCDEFVVDIAPKENYVLLEDVSAFIALAEDNNVTLENIETKYLLKQETLTSFTLGDRYRFSFFAEKEKVVVEIYDAQSRITDKGELLKSDDVHSLLTNLTQINIAK